MAIQFSIILRNVRLDAIETLIGTAPIFIIRSGTVPANCAAVETGTLLVWYALPSDWMAAASGGVVAKTGTWSGAAVGTGTAGYFRIAAAGSPNEAHIQGSITTDMTLDNTSIAVGQTVTVNTFQLTDGNA